MFFASPLWSFVCRRDAFRRSVLMVAGAALVATLAPMAYSQATDSVFSTDNLAAEVTEALSQKPITIASGPSGSMSYLTAGMLCEVMIRALFTDAPRCYVEPTTGSAMNLALLFSSEADFALIQSDREHFAFSRIGPYEGVEVADGLRRVAAIAGLPIQAVVKAQTGIEEIAALKDLRIGLGEEGSTQRLIGRVVLSTGGVQERELGFISAQRPDEQLSEFCSNELDAIILATTAPSPLVTEALERCNGKLLPLASEAFSALTDENNYLVPLELPASTYPNQPESVSSFGYVVSLVAMDGRRDALISTLAAELPLVYGSLSSRFDGFGLVPEDKLFDLGKTATLHSGVQAYLGQFGDTPNSDEADDL